MTSSFELLLGGQVFMCWVGSGSRNRKCLEHSGAPHQIPDASAWAHQIRLDTEMLKRRESAPTQPWPISRTQDGRPQHAPLSPQCRASSETDHQSTAATL